MAAITGPIPGIPRWVGARGRVHRKLIDGRASPMLLSVTLPPVRGFLYAAWLHLTRKTP